MPRLPLLGTGLSPIVQWVVVPAGALVWARLQPGFPRRGGAAERSAVATRKDPAKKS